MGLGPKWNSAGVCWREWRLDRGLPPTALSLRASGVSGTAEEAPEEKSSSSEAWSWINSIGKYNEIALRVCRSACAVSVKN